MVLHSFACHCIVSYGIAWYRIVGFGERAVSRRTPIYFIYFSIYFSSEISTRLLVLLWTVDTQFVKGFPNPPHRLHLPPPTDCIHQPEPQGRTFLFISTICQLPTEPPHRKRVCIAWSLLTKLAGKPKLPICFSTKKGALERGYSPKCEYCEPSEESEH